MKIKKSIIFFLQTLNGGGAERVTVNIIRKLDRELFDISLVLVKQEGDYLNLIPNDIKIYSLNSSKTLFSIKRLRDLIKEIRPDIIYSTLYRTHIALYFSLIGLRKDIKTIMRMPNSPKLVIRNNQLSSSYKFFLELALKSADLILAQTPEMKKEIVEYHYINNSKIEVLLNPLDRDFIDKSIKDIKNPFDNRYINLVASGRLTYQKGFDILIEAFNKLDKNRYRLYIIGKDVNGEKKEYDGLVDKLDLKSSVFFLGFQKNPYKYYYYADIFVLSSRWEGLPNTVLENLYLNKIVVATKCIPFMKELIRDGENGYLVDIENAKTLADAVKRASLIEKKIYTNNSMLYLDINKVFNLP